MWVLKVDNETIFLNDTTNTIYVDSLKLLKDVSPYISVPATLSALSDAQTVLVNLRDALIATGVMEVDV